MEIPGEKLIIKLWETIADKGTVIVKQVLSLGRFLPNAKMVETVATAIKTLGFDVQVGSLCMGRYDLFTVADA